MQLTGAGHGMWSIGDIRIIILTGSFLGYFFSTIFFLKGCLAALRANGLAILKWWVWMVRGLDLGGSLSEAFPDLF